MRKWYELIIVKTQNPVTTEDCLKFFTGEEAFLANAYLKNYKWVCIDQAFS